jgi:hypothetical protein
MDLNDLVPDRQPSGFWTILRRIGTIFGAILVVVGILSLLGSGGGSLHEAKYLLMAGGVILLVAQMLGRR